MGSLIRSPKLGARPRILHTPRRAREGADASHPAPLADAAGSGPSPAPPQPVVDPALAARIEAAQARATTAETHAAAAEADAAQARRELDGLRSELERLREQAHATGLEEGRELGREQARTELGARVEQAGACLEALRRRTAERLAFEEDAIVEAVWTALGKLLGSALSTRDGVAAAVRAVCEQIGGRDLLIVRLAPGDHELLAADPALLGSLAERVRLEPDASVELGGCIVESSAGSLDGRLELQLDRMRRTLSRARGAAGLEEEP